MHLKVNENPLLFVSLFGLRDNLFAAVKTVRRYTVAHMGLTRGWVDGQRRVFQLIVRAPIAACGRGPATFLNSHNFLLMKPVLMPLPS